MSTHKYARILTLTAVFMALPAFAQQDMLRIVSPASGTVVSPGQTVTVAVSADPSVEKLVLMGQNPLGIAKTNSNAAAGIWARGEGEASPQHFQLMVPVATRPGIYHVTAMGRTASGEVQSEALLLDVERPQDPARIWAEPAMMHFTSRGDQIPLRVLGAYEGGTQAELTKSSKVSYTSQDPRIATVNAEGIVTAVNPGKTTISVNTQSADYSIPVAVQ
jgi:large repetitive protein